MITFPDSQEEPSSANHGYQVADTTSTAHLQFRRPSQSLCYTHYTQQEPSITVPLPEVMPRITHQLSADSPRVTTPLPPLPPLPAQTTRALTFIPATKKREFHSSSAHNPRRHRPLAHVGFLVTSVIILALISLVVAPLDGGQHQQIIAQTIHIITSGSLSSFSTSQHLLPPTPTSVLLTNKGKCSGSDIWGICATAVPNGEVMGTGQMQPPMQGESITQVFAHPEYQLWCGCWRPHTGIDLAAPYGTPVMASDSGQVIWTGWDWSGLGWAVKINHGHNIATIYGHLARFIVSVGQTVTKGQIIAYEGSTGASTGPHVHFMVLVNNMWINPMEYVALP